jgi:hypothetical protein
MKRLLILVLALITLNTSAQINQTIGKTRFVTTKAALISAVSGFGNGTVTSVYVCNDIGLTSPLVIPKVVATKAKKVCIYLNGNALIDSSLSGLPYMIGRTTNSQDSALNVMQDVSVIIRDGELIGKGTGIALDIAATYGTILEGVDVTNFYEGVHLRFCLMASVRNSLATNIRNESYIADRGNWIGAGLTNCQSNSTRFEQCRAFSYDGAKAAFSAYDASGIIWEQCISEGGNTQYGWFFDGMDSPVVKDGLIHMGHSENTPSVAHIKSSIADGVFQVDGLFHQYAGVVLDANSSSGYPHFLVRNIPYMVTGSTFKSNGTGTIYSFDEMPSAWNALSTPNWTGGAVPYYTQQRGMNQSPFWRSTRSITVSPLPLVAP